MFKYLIIFILIITTLLFEYNIYSSEIQNSNIVNNTKLSNKNIFEKPNEPYVDLDMAVATCALPFWSGSWHAEFTFRGLGFVILKLLGVLMVYAAVDSMYKYHPGDKEYNDPGYGDIFFIGMGAFVAGAAFDGMFTYDFVRDYNRNNGYITQNTSIFIKPYINLSHDNYKFTNNTVYGVSISHNF